MPIFLKKYKLCRLTFVWYCDMLKMGQLRPFIHGYIFLNNRIKSVLRVFLGNVRAVAKQRRLISYTCCGINSLSRRVEWYRVPSGKSAWFIFILSPVWNLLQVNKVPISVADPWFHWFTPTLEGMRQPIIWLNGFQKLHENKSNWTEWGVGVGGGWLGTCPWIHQCIS